MNIHTILETKGGRTEVNKFSECHGPSNQLERYHSPSFETTIRCSTDEREEFEREVEISLTADQFEVPTFEQLAKWCAANCQLNLFGVFTQPAQANCRVPGSKPAEFTPRKD
jgi:hypothetical protein